MDSLLLNILITILCSLLLILLVQMSRSNATPLPGPAGLPIIGSFYQLKPRAYLAFCEMKKKYGSVFTIQIGMSKHIVLTSYSSIKEAFIDKKDNFSGRITDKFINENVKNSGIAQIDGPVWQEHRRFSLQTLKDLGLGRNLSSEIILNECEKLQEQLDKRVNSPIDILDLLKRAVANVICTMAFSDQPGYEPNDEFSVVTGNIEENIRTPFMMMLPVMFPQMFYFYPLMKMLPSVKKMYRDLDEARNYIRTKVEEHKQTLDTDGEPRDFTDAYLLEQTKSMAKDGKSSTFTDWQLIQTILEMFFAGTDTTRNSLSWAILWMGIRPDLQTKVQQEIDDNLDASQPVLYTDRTRLHLVQAVLDEVQRWASIVPYSLMHRNFKEDTIEGKRIPANSNITPCLYAVHHDPEVWQKPDEFYPEHFLTEDGRHYKSRNELIAFSLGRRSCLGESLARMEYFMLFTAIMRRYRVSLDPDSEKNLPDIMMGLDGSIRSPGLHRIILKIRK